MKDITLKEVVEFYFDRHIALPCIYYNAGDKKMWNRTIESYNPTTGDFKINKCKDTFNVNTSWITICIESRDAGWDDLVCRHFWGKSFQDIQNLIQRKMDYNEDDTTVTEMGGSWMKRTASHPRFIQTVILGEPVEAIKTYSTITNIKVGGYYCGGTYSNTSTKWAYEAGLVNHYVRFTKDTDNDEGV